MLAEALKNNPDIRVGEAKVREADAELNRVRLQVAHKVIAWRQAWEAQKTFVDSAEADAKRAQELHRRGAISQEEIGAVQQKLAQAKAKLAEMEAEMPLLLGKHPQAAKTEQRLRGEMGPVPLEIGFEFPTIESLRAAVRSSNLVLAPPQVPPASMADKIRKALETPIKAEFKQKSVKEFIKALEPNAPGLVIQVNDLYGEGGILDTKIDFRCEGIPLSAVLQAIEDKIAAAARPKEEGLYPASYRFVIRDYGLLFIPEDRLPPGAVLLQSFLKSSAPK
jgi:hypothetical protein